MLKQDGVSTFADWSDTSDHRPHWIDIDNAVVVASIPGATPIGVLRARYLALGPIKKWVSDRKMLGRRANFQAFPNGGPAFAASLRRTGVYEGRPDVAALLVAELPVDPPELEDWPTDGLCWCRC